MSTTLDEFLARKRLSVAEFAAIVGVPVQTVYRYLDGSRIPSRIMMGRIAEATDNAVTANSFYEVSLPAGQRER